MPVEKVSIRSLCEQVGVSHLQVTEVLRRVAREVRDDKEVITQTVGTFYLKRRRPTTKNAFGTFVDVPARVSVALRGPRFPGRELTPLTIRVRVMSFANRFDEEFSNEEDDIVEPLSGSTELTLLIGTEVAGRIRTTWTIMLDEDQVTQGRRVPLSAGSVQLLEWNQEEIPFLHMTPGSGFDLGQRVPMPVGQLFEWEHNGEGNGVGNPGFRGYRMFNIDLNDGRLSTIAAAQIVVQPDSIFL